MAFATARSLALKGADGHVIDVQVDVSPGLVNTTIVGRVDKTLSEARDRVRMAINNDCGRWPATKRVTILLAPADLPKSGTHYDLAIAMAVMAADKKHEELTPDLLEGWAFIGELSVAGALRPVPGVLPMVIAAAAHGITRVFVPEPQAGEAGLVPGMTVFGVRSLAQVSAVLRGAEVPEADPVVGPSSSPLSTWRGEDRLADVDLRDLDGLEDVRYAVEVAAAGGHPTMLIGPRGTGKTSIAERIPTILPDLTTEQALEVTALHSVAGVLPQGSGLVRRPPWFAPHHSATAASVLGGGTGRVRPGQVSLAHHGVLFLDEFPHFRADVVEAMRQPLESGEVTIARGEESATYPARSLVVLAANPCPCGNFHGLSGGSCECTELQRSHYRRKLTGPILDRVDIWMEVRPQGRRRGAVLRPGAGVLRRRASPGGRGQAAPGPPLPRLLVAPQRLLSRSGPRRAVAAGARRPATRRQGAVRRQAHPAWADPRAAPGLDRGGLRGGAEAGGARGRDRVGAAVRRLRALAAGERGSSGVMSAARVRSAPPGTEPVGQVPEAERLARVALSCAVEPGDGTTSSLIRQMGAERALAKARSATEGEPGEMLAQRLAEIDPVRQLDQAARCGIRFLVPGDPEWPTSLDELDDAITVEGFGGTPPGLWVKGPMPLTELATSVAVVGSRAASVYGVELARAVCEHLALSGVPVVSGGALGIDFEAHNATLSADGVTAAVLACGVDRVYPQQNRPLLQHLAAEFAVVSEQPPASAPTRPRFLARNRLIAAMTNGTVVVEAALRSGALNTAGWAESLNRHVMCMPGPVTSYTSQGVNNFLREGRGTVVTHGAEVLELVGAAGQYLVDPPRGEHRPRDALTPTEQTVVEWVPVSESAGVESISRLCGLALRTTEGALRRLRSKGFVQLTDEGWRLVPDV